VQKIGLALIGSAAIGEVVGRVSAAEKSGYHSFWMHENYFSRDAITTLTACAASTKTIRLATGVVNPYTRNPALTAVSLATIQELSEGRVILGIGAGNPVQITKMGIENSKPVRALDEALSIMREMWAGREVSFEGRVFRVKGAKMDFTPKVRIPVYVACGGPLMIRLGSKVGDGVLFNKESPVTMRKAIRRVERAASEFHRRADEIERAVNLYCLPARNVEEAVERIRRDRFFIMLMTLLYSRVIEDAGLDPSLFVKMRKTFLSGDAAGAGRMLSDEVIRDFALLGNVDDMKETVRNYLDVGVTLPIIQPLPTAGEDGFSRILVAGNEIAGASVPPT